MEGVHGKMLLGEFSGSQYPLPKNGDKLPKWEVSAVKTFGERACSGRSTALGPADHKSNPGSALITWSP